MTIQLRTYQKTALEKFYKSHVESVLMVAPTGAGKGTMAASVMARYARQGKRVLFLVHRRELVHDMTERLAQLGVPVAQTLYSDRKVRVVSVQAAQHMRIQPVDLLVVDEAHHYASDVWQQVVAHAKAQRIIGFTATPERSDGRPLGDMFEQIVEVVSYSSLIDRKYIVPCRVLRPQRKMTSTEIAQDPVDAYLEYGRGERTLIFVRRVKEAEEVARRLSGEGVPAGVVTSATKKEERDKTMLRLEQGHLDVVVNVGVLTEGIDVPHVTCIVLARPCSHASTYLQIVGRALRAAEGKEMATLIDLVGASYVHGLPAEDRTYLLEGDHGIDRKNNSGPSGPSGIKREEPDIENLGLELVEALPEALRRYLPARIPIYQPKGTRQNHSEPKQKASRPKRPHAPGPLPITDGFVFQDRGWWQLGWSERGKKKRAGLATKDENEARELYELFKQKGIAVLKEEVRKRKRWLCCLDKAQGKGARSLIIKTWNEDKTKRISIGLGTTNKEEGEALLALYKAGKTEEFERRIAKNREESEGRANLLRAAAARRRWQEARTSA